MPADCTPITAEIDQQLANAARELLADDPRLEVVTGDAASIIPGHGPFDLLFADSGVRDKGTSSPYRDQPPLAKQALVRICTHFFVTGAWLEEGALIREASRLSGIPGALIHGGWTWAAR